MEMTSAAETLARMRALYPHFLDENQLSDLDPANVPARLVMYIPYAALWGVTDDLERERRVNDAPPSAKEDLVALIRKIDDELDAWLAGKEVSMSPPTKEYVAFSAMRMAADFI